MRKLSFPSILAIFFLLAGVVAGVLMVQYKKEYRLSASISTTPKNVRITNITDSSFTVSWTTDDISTGFVKYGETKALGKTSLDKIATSYYTHYVEIKNLKPETSYLFKINSNAIDYDNNGVEWITKTGPLVKDLEANIISGTLVNSLKNPVKNALVYITTTGSSTLSTYTSNDGSFIVNLSLLRNQTLNQRLIVGEKENVLEIDLQTGPPGTASVKIYPNSAKPIPEITLGRTHDFRNLVPKKEYSIPTASFDLPKISTQESKTE